MKNESITFRVETGKRKILDALARQCKQRRSDLLNVALDNYIELQEWQAAHIQEGLRQAKAGEFALEKEVKSFFNRK